jgi:hypothetical protein
MVSRHKLSLQEKLQLIYDNKYRNGLLERRLTGKYNISLDSVSNIFKHKIEYLYENPIADTINSHNCMPKR